MKRILKFVVLLMIIVSLFVATQLDKQVSIPILAYHQISQGNNPMSVHPEEFARQLAYLKEQGYTSVTLDEVVRFMHGEGALPSRPIVITFDDGYVDNYHTAVPLLRSYGFTAIIFVITDNIGKPDFLSWDQMKAVQERAVHIGSHTMTHADLTKLSPEEIKQEVERSKQALEMGLGTPVDYLAFPYGNYNDQVITALKTAGYKGACAAALGMNRVGDNVYTMERIYVGPSRWGFWEFKLRLARAKLVGIW